MHRYRKLFTFLEVSPTLFLSEVKKKSLGGCEWGAPPPPPRAGVGVFCSDNNATPWPILQLRDS
jgi:hypothetical protein